MTNSDPLNGVLAAELTERIRRFLPMTNDYQKDLAEAMEYSVMNGGKRIRPMLMLLSYRALGGDAAEEATLLDPFLAAIEMIHSYSLVHDDLPAMDNDRFRRGKLTTHARYGHAMGILAGDGLLNAAFETALRAEETTASAGRVMRALRVLAKRAGIYGMVGGQTVDVEKTGQPLTEEELTFVYELKTGALLQASMECGAILAGASPETIGDFGRIALKVGMAFQIRDDILDISSTSEELGKPVGSDEKNQKTTYVTLHGMRESEIAVESLSEEALALLGKYPGGQPEDPLYKLIFALINRVK